MRYLSIDIETTGLDPDRCQILEIGAVYDDGVSAIENLPTFHTFVWHPQIIGESRALSMNQRCLDVIAPFNFDDGANYLLSDAQMIMPPENVGNYLHQFCIGIEGFGTKFGRINIAGKNAGSFDWQFLRRLKGFPAKLFDHRFVDVGGLYLRPSDQFVPGLAKCLERAGLPSPVTHHALDDALQVVQLVRAWQEGIAT